MKGMIALWIVFLDAKWLCASYNVTFATSLVLLFGVRAGGTSLPERHVITAQETVVVVIEPLVVVGSPCGCWCGVWNARHYDIGRQCSATVVGAAVVVYPSCGRHQ